MVTAMKEKNKLNVVRVKLVEDIPLYSDEIVGSPDDAVDILKKELMVLLLIQEKLLKQLFYQMQHLLLLYIIILVVFQVLVQRIC